MVLQKVILMMVLMLLMLKKLRERNIILLVELRIVGKVFNLNFVIKELMTLATILLDK